MIDLHHLGPALRLLRVRSGLLQKEISDQTGMSRSQVSRYERGMDTPNLVTLSKYLNTVGAHFGDLHRAMHQTGTGTISQLTELSVRDLLRPIIDEAVKPVIDEAVRPAVGEVMSEHLDGRDSDRPARLPRTRPRQRRLGGGLRRRRGLRRGVKRLRT